MTRDDIARLAFSAILGAIFAVSITKPDLGFNQYIVRYLIFAVVTGISINSVETWRLGYLLSASVIAAFGVIGAVMWVTYMHQWILPDISAFRPLDLSYPDQRGAAIKELAALAGVCIIGVIVGSLAQPVTLGLLQRLMDIERAERLEKILKILLSVCGTVALLIAAIGG